MQKDRRRRLVNSRERVAQEILATAAGRNCARVFTKVRIADVLDIDRSGLDGAHYGYALRAHFDFVIADQDDMPLFAVEFDGPQHDHGHAQANDRKKNFICRHLGLPLARVRDDHLFGKARGIDYLTWFTELYFSFHALLDAQVAGLVPWDEPLDPTMFVSHPHIPGRFPLFVSADVRRRIEGMHARGILKTPVPQHFSGYDEDGCARALVIVATKDGACLVSDSSLYLEGFGLTASEAAEEIAVVNLGTLAGGYARTGKGALAPLAARQRLVELLRATGGSLSFGGMGDTGFAFSFAVKEGKARWLFDPIGSAQAVEVEARI